MLVGMGRPAEVGSGTRNRGPAWPWCGGLAVVSLAATVAVRILLGSPLPDNAALVIWPLAETAALVSTATIATRYAHGHVAAIAIALMIVAIALIPTRFVGAFGLAVHVFWVAAGFLPALVAVGAGLYLRILDTAQAAQVREVAQRQRLQLARDLHDFVAHDLSGMVVQAQAAQLVAKESPDRALEALRVIERAGLHALAATDRAVQALDVEGGSPPSMPGVADLESLLQRFRTTTGAAATLTIDAPSAAGLELELDHLAYRVVTEALTNALRHGRPGGTTAVTLLSEGAELLIEVRNDLPADQPAESPSGNGSGLTGLAEKLERSGGSLRFGPGLSPAGNHVWILQARLPAGAAA